MVSFTTLPLYPLGRRYQYAMDKMLVGPQEAAWTLWRREKSLTPARNQTLAV
jgi:hypothetical protein